MTTISEISEILAERPERRSSLRQRVLKGGVVRFNKGYGALECVVRNLSEKGAQLAFGETSAVPARFELKISGDESPREAAVRWRKVQSVGVTFG